MLSGGLFGSVKESSVKLCGSFCTVAENVSSPDRNAPVQAGHYHPQRPTSDKKTQVCMQLSVMRTKSVLLHAYAGIKHATSDSPFCDRGDSLKMVERYIRVICWKAAILCYSETLHDNLPRSLIVWLPVDFQRIPEIFKDGHPGSFPGDRQSVQNFLINSLHVGYFPQIWTRCLYRSTKQHKSAAYSVKS